MEGIRQLQFKDNQMQDSGRRRASPGRKMFARKQEFQPGLYITARLTEEQVLAIKEAFDSYDSNKTGILSPNDLKVALYHHGYHASRQTIYNIIAEYDEDALGGLTFPAFISIISGEPIDRERTQDLKRVFRKIDKDNKGYLVRRDIENVLKELGEQWDDDQVELVLAKASPSNPGRISFETFCQVMHHPASLN